MSEQQDDDRWVPGIVISRRDADALVATLNGLPDDTRIGHETVTRFLTRTNLTPRKETP